MTIHGALLLVALLVAWPTWTRRPPSNLDRQGTVIWERDTADVRALSYRGAGREVSIERRTEGGESFLWGVEVTSRPGSEGSDTARFPVGVVGRQLAAQVASLRVVRELGSITPDREAEFGLAEPNAHITIDFGDATRVLEVGAPVYSGSDRYGRDPSTGSAYVLPAALVGPLSIGSGAIRERQIHYFGADDVARVRVQGLGEERVVERRSGEGRAPAAWHRPEGDGQVDLTFANFMERVSQLAIAGFEGSVPPESLDLFLRIEYFGHDDQPLGFLELLSDPDSPTGEYYLSSERTRIPAVAVRLLAERVEQGVAEIF